MRKFCKAISLMMLMLFGFQTSTFASKEDIVDQLLDSLDLALKGRQAAIDKREAEAEAMARKADQLPVSLEKAQAYCHTSEAFMHLSSDSAIKYALKEYDVVQAINDTRQLLFCRLDLFKAYTRRGDTGKAYEVVGDIGDISTIGDPLARELYAEHMMDLYIKLQTTGNNSGSTPSKSAKVGWEYYSPYLKQGSALYFFYQSVCNGKIDVQAAIDVLNKMSEMSFDYAKLATAIALEYNRQGDSDEYYEFLLRSAISDAKLGNTEVSSLLYLLETPLLEKDIRRSYEYTKVLADNVMRYHDLSRALRVIEIQEKVSKQFSEERTKLYIFVGIAFFLLVVALVLSMLQIHILRKGSKKKE